MRATQSNPSVTLNPKDTAIFSGPGSPLRQEIPAALRDLPAATLSATPAQYISNASPIVPANPVLHLLVVDDDDAVREACAEIARKMNFAVVTAQDIAAARSILLHRKIDLILLDLKPLGTGSGLTLLEEVKTTFPDTEVIIMTAFASVGSAVEAMRVGASDYLTKPFALEELVTILEHAGERRHFDTESRRLQQRLRTQKGTNPLIGSSPEMEKLFRILSKVAQTRHPVLILGESGTGKELVARQIHFNGPMQTKAFLPVDCGSMVPELIESELFGSAKGAGPGGRAREGLLVTAGQGTVLLDEIGELTLELQARLLRTLQEKSVRPVGGGPPQPITARILAATNRNLVHMVEHGLFRKDLYYRLNVVNLRIPPLRDRREDIPVLAQHFVERLQKKSGLSYKFSDDTLRTMMAYSWPGNVRELEDAIERACAMSSGPVLHMGDLPTQLQNHRMQTREVVETHNPEEPEKRIVSIATMEREAILSTIRRLKGDKLTAAKLLGIGKTTMYRKLKEYGIEDEESST